MAAAKKSGKKSGKAASADAERLQQRARKVRADTMRRHVLVCVGDDCDKKKRITKQLRHGVAAAKLRDQVTVTKVTCLDICKKGPICVVYPEGVWYHSVDADVAAEIVDEHLRDGRVVTASMFLQNRLQDDGGPDE